MLGRGEGKGERLSLFSLNDEEERGELRPGG